MGFRVGAYVASEKICTLSIKVAPFLLSSCPIFSSFLPNGDEFILKFADTVKILVILRLFCFVIY